MTEPSAHPDPRQEAARLLAHDIRAAVSDVIGGLRLIQPDDLSQAPREQLGRIQSAAELLSRLVEELLTGDDELEAQRHEPRNLDLHRFLAEELRRWRGAARPSGTAIRVEQPDDLPRVVRLDGLRLRRVISNLMGNALRHASGGIVTLGAMLDEDANLILRVEDDGPGFPDDLLPHLFAADVRRADSPGTGLGLHIAAAHAEGMGGRLTARNLDQGGACIALVIPASVWRRDDGAGPQNLADLTGKRILIADDSGTTRLLARAMLERLGAECETASDGIEALNWLSRERFDLALIDIEMPTLSGIDVIRSERLRQARGIAPPMAVVAMTGHSSGPEAEAVIEEGADGILGKPLVGVEEFGRTIAHFIANGPDPSSWRPELAPALSAATLSELMRAAGPDQQAALLDRLREDLTEVEQRLAGAIRANDLTIVQEQTHVLLSLSSAVGALPTQEAARRLNRLARDGSEDAVSIAGKLCLARLADLRQELSHAV